MAEEPIDRRTPTENGQPFGWGAARRRMSGPENIARPEAAPGATPRLRPSGQFGGTAARRGWGDAEEVAASRPAHLPSFNDKTASEGIL